MAVTLREMMNQPFLAEIAEGAHPATITNVVYNAHETDESKDYLKLDFQLDGKRPYSRNMFQRDMSIMLSHLRRQLGRADEDINPLAFLEELKTTQTSFNIWFSYPTVATRSGARRVQNVNFLAPLASSAEDSDELPFTP